MPADACTLVTRNSLPWLPISYCFEAFNSGIAMRFSGLTAALGGLQSCVVGQFPQACAHEADCLLTCCKTLCTTIAFAANSNACPGVNQYTHGGATSCQTCPANAIAVATKGNCICKAGYIPKAGTSSQAKTLECLPCAAGSLAMAGDDACTPCAGNSYSSAAAGRCEACPAGTQVNAGKTDCTCTGSSCTKSGTGWATICACTNVANNTTTGECVTITWQHTATSKREDNTPRPDTKITAVMLKLVYVACG
jgi:hypothetical protein